MLLFTRFLQPLFFTCISTGTWWCICVERVRQKTARHTILCHATNILTAENPRPVGLALWCRHNHDI